MKSSFMLVADNYLRSLLAIVFAALYIFSYVDLSSLQIMPLRNYDYYNLY
jgi:hypothetical protein